MRGGGGGATGKAPARQLYRPGSGPLRKSGRLEDYEHENNTQDRPKTSVQERLKPMQFGPSSNRSSSSNQQCQNSSRYSEINNISEKFKEVQISYKNHNDDHGHRDRVKNNHVMTNDPKRKNKKPEKEVYMPKKVKEAIVGQETSYR